MGSYVLILLWLMSRIAVFFLYLNRWSFFRPSCQVKLSPFRGLYPRFFCGERELEFVLSICEASSTKVGKVHASVIQFKQYKPSGKKNRLFLYPIFASSPILLSLTYGGGTPKLSHRCQSFWLRNCIM